VSDVVEARLAQEDELEACFEIRREVFVVGQSVDEAIERDGRDPECAHFIVLMNGTPAGTARMRVTPDGVAKAERVAVLARFQRKGLGHRVMGALEDEARRRGHAAVVLGAQTYIVPFYEQRGYVVFGEEYVEANIPHRMMRLELTP
jgi:predicted GNAT family N-acyltransferase